MSIIQLIFVLSARVKGVKLIPPRQIMRFRSFKPDRVKGDFVWNRWYVNEPHFIKAYDLLNFRNHNTDRKGFFVVLARTQNDVIESVKFATSHNIGVSVFSTGHEFNDRGSGPCPNTLLIRTTCLTAAEFDLTEDFQR